MAHGQQPEDTAAPKMTGALGQNSRLLPPGQKDLWQTTDLNLAGQPYIACTANPGSVNRMQNCLALGEYPAHGSLNGDDAPTCKPIPTLTATAGEGKVFPVGVPQWC